MTPYEDPEASTAYLPAPEPGRQDIETAQDNTLHTFNNAPEPTDRHRSSIISDSCNFFCAVVQENRDGSQRFINLSYVSNIASMLRDKIPCATHTNGLIHGSHAFTGRDIVAVLRSLMPRELASGRDNARLAALQISRSLHEQMFFRNVEGDNPIFQDNTEDLYALVEDCEGRSYKRSKQATVGIVTMLTCCYSPSCKGGLRCYAPRCPWKGLAQLTSPADASVAVEPEDWSNTIPPGILTSLSSSEIGRQRVIHKLIKNEERYVGDLDIVESVFISPLREARPSLMPLATQDALIGGVFANIVELGKYHRRLLMAIYARQQEQNQVVDTIGDILLEVSSEFRSVYQTHAGCLPLAEKRMLDEVEHNPSFRLFLEKCNRTLLKRLGRTSHLDLRHYLRRPVEHLEKYSVLLDAVLSQTPTESPDATYLREAKATLSSVRDTTLVRAFQAGATPRFSFNWDWDQLVSPDVRDAFAKGERLRQCIMFEFINTEMHVVDHLDKMESLYIEPLRNADQPIIPPERLDHFIADVFHNYKEILAYHRQLVNKLHDIQRREHPKIQSITAPVLDGAREYTDAYMKYVPNHINASWRVEDETAINPAFRAFLDERIRHPDAKRICLKYYMNLPIARLIRLEVMFKRVLEATSAEHDDQIDLPQIIEVMCSLRKSVEPLVQSARQRAQLQTYNSNLVYGQGQTVDLDLLNENRSLIHHGKLLRPPTERAGWTEYHVVLFDHYLIMTKPKVNDWVTKYHIQHRPIPLESLSIVDFSHSPMFRGIVRPQRTASGMAISPDISRSALAVYPFTIQQRGSRGGYWTLCAESSYACAQWKEHLEEALKLHKTAQASCKVFEIRMLNVGAFLMPPPTTSQAQAALYDGTSFAGRVTCSVPFDTPNGQSVAIGCAGGVWVGSPDGRSPMRRVLDVKVVTQCAVLEDLGVFLVLANKLLLAYHLNALVRASTSTVYTPPVPQKVSDSRDVYFFTSGILDGRTVVVYMNKKGAESVFHIVEPVIDRINETPKAAISLSRILGRSKPSQWFQNYMTFSVPFISFDAHLFGGKIAIRLANHFYLLDPTNSSMALVIPQLPEVIATENAVLARRCLSNRSIAIFQHTADEYLMCFDEFGIFLNQDGRPSRGVDTMEWEGRAERAVLQPPYIILFDSSFIEVRHLETGRLVQVVPGNNIGCIWAGTGVSSTSSLRDSLGQISEPCLYAVMETAVAESSMPDDARALGGFAQHIFELLPTSSFDSAPGGSNILSNASH